MLSAVKHLQLDTAPKYRGFFAALGMTGRDIAAVLAVRAAKHLQFYHVPVIAMVLAAATVAVGAPGDAHVLRKIPAEERRLSTALFRDGLKQRGLHDLLELHLKDFPLQSPVEEQLMQRDVEMARFRDPARAPAERLAAGLAANVILEKLIQGHPAEPRRFDWMYSLGYSLVFEQAEPHATNDLYFGDSPEDLHRLAEAAGAGVAVLRTLSDAIAQEYARIDRLSADELQVLEQTGYLDQLDRIAPNADYVLLWAVFYRAIARPLGDAARADGLNEVLAGLSATPAILNTPQEQSRVQVSAHVLAGMAHRRLGRAEEAREYFDRAKSSADRLVDPAARALVTGPAILAEIESVRNELAGEHWHAAAAGVEQLRRRVASNFDPAREEAFVLRLVAALLERDLFLARALSAEATQRGEEAAKHRREAWQALADLAINEPQHRDRLYAVLNRRPPVACDPATLDPPHQIAALAEVVVNPDAVEAGEKARRIEAAERLLSGLDQGARPLAPEILRLLGTIHYREGDVAAAAQRFLQIAGQYQGSAEGPKSAELAVQLASTLCADRSSFDQAGDLYRRALQTLLANYPSSPAAREWRFFYAELLHDQGALDEAVAEYKRVSPDHERAHEAALRSIQAQAEALFRLTAEPDNADPAGLRERADGLLTTWRTFLRQDPGTAARTADEAPDGRQRIAEATLSVAEAMTLPQVGRCEVALELLIGFEERFGDFEAIRGRLWRDRMVAYGACGRLDETTAAMSAYVATDPGGAGVTLQSLYEATRSEIEGFEVAGDAEAARRRGQTALAVAKALVKWADQSTSLTQSQRKTLRVQLGEAHLAAGEAEEARQVFAEYAAIGADSLQQEPYELRALLGYARSLESEGRCTDALPLFNRLATGLSPESSLRWESLCGDLRCRTVLNEPAEGILRVIQQQRHLHPDLGGARIAQALGELERQNEKRRSRGARSRSGGAP